MKTKEEIEKVIMESLNWLDIPLGNYTVRIVDDGLMREVELIEWKNV